MRNVRKKGMERQSSIERILEKEEKKMSLIIKKKDIPLIAVSFLACIYVMSNAYIIRESGGATAALSILETVIYLGLILFLLLSSFQKHMLFRMICCIALLLVCYLFTGQADLLKAVILLISVKDLEYNKVFRVLWKSYFFAVLVVVALFVCGLSNPGVMRRGGITLGFATTNIASRMIQNTLFLWISSICGIQKYKGKRLFGICVCVALFSYITTKSRMSSVLLILLPAIIWLMRKIRERKQYNVVGIVCGIVPVILMLVTVFLSMQYNRNTTVQMLNVALSNRIYMNLVAFQKYGITWFGNAANISSFAGVYDSVVNKYVNFLTIDSQYTYLIVYYGIVGTLVVIAGMFFCIKKTWDKGKVEITVMLLLISNYFFTETVGSLFGCPILLYLTLYDNDAHRLQKKI